MKTKFSMAEKVEIYAHYFGIRYNAEFMIEKCNLDDQWFEEHRGKVYTPLTDD